MALNTCLLKYNFRKTIFCAFFIFLINVAMSFFYNLILDFFKINYKSNPIPFSNIYEEFFLVVIFAPLFETIIFQFFPSYYLRNFNTKIIVISSSLLFGISHWYSVTNFIHGLLAGFILIIGYLSAKQRKLNPIVTIFLAHSIYNLFVFICRNFF